VGRCTPLIWKSRAMLMLIRSGASWFALSSVSVHALRQPEGGELGEVVMKVMGPPHSQSWPAIASRILWSGAFSQSWTHGPPSGVGAWLLH